MSDEEEQMHEEEEETEEAAGAAEPSGPSEAELAMQKRRAKQISSEGLDEAAQEMLEENRQMRKEMEKEIQEMRERSERRKREREEEEQRIAAERAEEEARRRADEDARKAKKEEEENAKREARAAKMAEFEKWKNPQKRNFVISKREGGDEEEAEEEGGEKEQKKSKEQLEAEKRAILAQRLSPLEIEGFDAAKLADKAKELYNLILRLEGEKYDLEKRFKSQQVDMQEMAERARQMNKVGKGEGCVRRVVAKEDEVDKIQERFAGAPAKIMMYSAFERQKDKRSYKDRYSIFTGPMYGYPAERINPQRRVTWNDQGQPVYIEDENAPAEGEGEAAAAEEE